MLTPTALEALKRPENTQTTQAYFNWRISNAVFIQQRHATYKCANYHVAPLLKKIMNHLAPFAGIDTTPTLSTPRVEIELEHIIARAVNLDAEMWRQKAFFYPGKLRVDPNTFYQFNPDSMELWETPLKDHVGELPEVTLIVSPSLLKSGNSDGDSYDVNQVVVKSQVSREFAHCNAKPGPIKNLHYQPTQTSRAVKPMSHSTQYEKRYPDTTIVEHRPGQIIPYQGPRRTASTSQRSTNTHRIIKQREPYA